MMARARSKGLSHQCYFGDLRKAFDLVSSAKVQETIEALTPAGTLRRALLDRQRLLTTSVKVDQCTGTFTLPNVVAQGDALGPISFIGTYRRQCQQLDTDRDHAWGTCHFLGHQLASPMHRALFVDDHAEFWLEPTEVHMQGPLSRITRHQQGWGLHLNWDKVQIITAPCGRGSKRRFPNKGRVRYAGRNVGGTYTAKYLGTLVAHTGCVTTEVRARIRKAMAALTKLARYVWNQHIPLELKVALYLSLIRSILCYGLECWHLQHGHLRELEQFQMRALRWLAKAPAHKTHETNEHLRTRLKVPTVESWVRYRRLTWLQDCVRHPMHHAQALCALFGGVAWDPLPPTFETVPYLQLLEQDLELLFPQGDHEGDTIAPSLLQALGTATDTALRALLSFRSTHERGSAPVFGPRNAPIYKCTQCSAAFDTEQRLAVHAWSTHGTRNMWRAMIQEPQCPFCRCNFASLETAKRHVSRNVCGLRVAPAAAPPPPSTLTTQPTLHRWATQPRQT